MAEPHKSVELGKEFAKLKEEKNFGLFKLFYEQVGAKIRSSLHNLFNHMQRAIGFLKKVRFLCGIHKC